MENQQGKVWLQVLGFIGVLLLVTVDALLPTFTVERWIYMGMMAFMLGVRPETLPELLRSFLGVKNGK